MSLGLNAKFVDIFYDVIFIQCFVQWTMKNTSLCVCCTIFFFNYRHIFYIYNIWHVSSDQCEDKFSRLFLLTLSVKANRMSNLIVCVLGWSTDWGADRWVQGGILPLRQGWRRHHHHQGVGNCKFQQHSLNNFLQPITSSKGSPRQTVELALLIW